MKLSPAAHLCDEPKQRKHKFKPVRNASKRSAKKPAAAAKAQPAAPAAAAKSPPPRASAPGPPANAPTETAADAPLRLLALGALGLRRRGESYGSVVALAPRTGASSGRRGALTSVAKVGGATPRRLH